MPAKPIVPRREPGRGRWRVTVPRDLAGKRRRRFFTNKADAEKLCVALENLRADHLNSFELLDMKNRAQVGRLLDKLGGCVDTLGRAVEFWLAHHTRETRTVPSLVNEFYADRKRAGWTGVYLRSLKCNLGRFALEFSGREAQTLTTEEISKWVYSGDYSDSSRKSFLRDVKTMLKYALDRHYIGYNPAQGIQPPKTSSREKVVFTPDEAERLMRAAERNDPGMVPYLALIMFGGFRPDEAARIERGMWKDDAIRLPAEATKNNHPRLQEFGPVLTPPTFPMDTLSAWLRASPKEWGFSNLRRRMDALRAASCVGERGPCRPVKWGHDIIRKSFVSYGAALYGIKATALRADHSEGVLKDHYLSLVLRDDAERFWGILPR